MRISIIIACLNAEAVIGRCLESIARQDYRDIEVVVADGGSQDKTVEVVRQYVARMGRRLVWFSEPDRGIADAWNKAIPRASGQWVLFLGSDDSLAAPDIISRAVPVLSAASPQFRLVYGQIALVTPDGRVVEYVNRPWSPSEFRGCRTALAHQAIFHHHSLFIENGPFDNTYRITSDYDFLLRELMRAEPHYAPELIVANMQLGGFSTSRRHAVNVVAEEIRLYWHHVGGIPLVLLWRLIKTWGISTSYRIGGDRLALPLTNVYRRLIGGRPPLRY